MVQVGVLTDEEFAQLQPNEQEDVQRSTEDLLRRYGEDFFVRERERLRSELQFVYGRLDSPSGFVS